MASVVQASDMMMRRLSTAARQGPGMNPLVPWQHALLSPKSSVRHAACSPCSSHASNSSPSCAASSRSAAGTWGMQRQAPRRAVAVIAAAASTSDVATEEQQEQLKPLPPAIDKISGDLPIREVIMDVLQGLDARPSLVLQVGPISVMLVLVGSQ